MRRCRDERAPARERKSGWGGGLQRVQLVPCPSAPGADRNSLPRTASPHRVPEARRWLMMEPLRLQDPASPCLPRPRVPPSVSPLPHSEGQRASRTAQPGLPPACETPVPHLRSPWLVLVTSPSRRRRAGTLTRTPLHLFSKVPVPGFPGMGD